MSEFVPSPIPADGGTLWLAKKDSPHANVFVPHSLKDAIIRQFLWAALGETDDASSRT